MINQYFAILQMHGQMKNSSMDTHYPQSPGRSAQSTATARREVQGFCSSVFYESSARPDWDYHGLRSTKMNSFLSEINKTEVYIWAMLPLSTRNLRRRSSGNRSGCTTTTGMRTIGGCFLCRGSRWGPICTSRR